MGMRALWKGAKLEVESVVREVADRVLFNGEGVEEGKKVGKGKLRDRAVALEIVSIAFSFEPILY